MEQDNMTQVEFYMYLMLLAKHIRAEAKTVEEAAKIIEDLAANLKPKG